MTCPYCQARPIRVRIAGHPPVDCGDVRCRLARRRETNARHHRAQAARRKAANRETPDREPRQYQTADYGIEERFQAARQARLARERAAGQRTYTITDGWAQKPGAGHYDAGPDGGFGW